MVRKTHEQIDVKERGLIVGSADRTGNKRWCTGDNNGRPYDVKVMFTMNFTLAAVGTGLAPVRGR